ncbi:MAG TPA: NAD(P)-dependent oxidoreductase [Thermoanaerobaculia bacterium]
MTSKKRLLIAAEVDRTLLDRVRGDARFDVVHSPTADETSLAATVGEAEILVTRYHNKVTSRVLDAATRLELIIQGTSGLDNIDLDAAARRGIRVLGLPGENANAVAELVIGHMIALTRTVPAYDAMMRAGVWQREDCATRRELRGYCAGIVGLGRVGGRVAHLARAFGVEVHAYDPYVAAADRATLDELLASSEILTLHVPLTDETRRMIGARELDRLPRGAFVINTSRGEVLDAAALLDRLASGHLAGAALDVYDEEPPRGVVWPEDRRLILTPHIAGCSAESKASIGRLIYERICEFCDSG